MRINDLSKALPGTDLIVDDGKEFHIGREQSMLITANEFRRIEIVSVHIHHPGLRNARISTPRTCKGNAGWAVLPVHNIPFHPVGLYPLCVKTLGSIDEDDPRYDLAPFIHQDKR
jgi:hypothetical protein